jgi:hypothetical protein
MTWVVGVTGRGRITELELAGTATCPSGCTDKASLGKGGTGSLSTDDPTKSVLDLKLLGGVGGGACLGDVAIFISIGEGDLGGGSRGRGEIFNPPAPRSFVPTDSTATEPKPPLLLFKFPAGLPNDIVLFFTTFKLAAGLNTGGATCCLGDLGTTLSPPPIALKDPVLPLPLPPLPCPNPLPKRQGPYTSSPLPQI